MNRCNFCNSTFENPVNFCPNCGGKTIAVPEKSFEEHRIIQAKKEKKPRIIAIIILIIGFSFLIKAFLVGSQLHSPPNDDKIFEEIGSNVLLFIIFLIVSLFIPQRYLCGKCGHKLQSNHVKICSICKAELK